MLKAYEALIALVLFLGAAAGGFYEGAHYQEIKVEAAQKAAVDQAVKDAKAQDAIDYGRAQQAALDQQKRDLTHAQKSHKLAAAVAVDHSATDCKLAASTYGVLLDSLDAANGAAAASSASASYGAVRPGDPAGRRVTGSGGVQPGQHGLDPLDVQSTAQPAR